MKTQVRLIRRFIFSGIFVLFLFSAFHAAAETDGVYENLIIFSDVISEIEKSYVDPVSSEEIIIKAVQGMVRSLDPHSAYLEPEEYSALKDDTRGEFSGIGVVMVIKNDILTIVSPIEGSPAYKAGIIAGDVIVKVNDEPTRDMSITEAVNRIKGKKGTSLSLTILRGDETYLRFELVRDDIPILSVKSAPLKPGYGYIAITNFNKNTGDDLVSALKILESATPAMTGLVLDLRGNPGGLLNQAVDVADMFIDEGTIVTIKGHQERETQVWNAHKNSTPRDYPIVVLINGGSASASEIVAGALQDHKRALVLGTTSFGKGTVQNIREFTNGAALKLTVARYYTPGGRSIQAEGITPDIEMQYSLLDKIVKKKRIIKESDLRNHLDKGDETTHILQNLDTYPEGTVKTGLNLRKSPSKDSEILTTLSRGDAVKIADKEDGEWLRIIAGGKIGYIKNNKKYISRNKPPELSEAASFSPEELLRDNQIKRALELLVSHNIFSERME